MRGAAAADAVAASPNVPEICIGAAVGASSGRSAAPRSSRSPSGRGVLTSAATPDLRQSDTVALPFLSRTMSRLKLGVVRYATVADAIGRAVGVESAPDCRIGHGRITLTFRRLGGTRWPEARRVEYALEVAAAARAALAADARRAVRERVAKAVVVAFEDATLVRGCAVTARWECVVPAPPSAP